MNDSTKNYTATKVEVTLAYVAMIAMNALANIFPINGITTGEVSDKYTNLFAPTGLTFSIWSVIYILLLGFVLYQWGLFRGESERREDEERLIQSVRIPFIVSSIANILWLLAWHYDFIGVSTLLMLALLGSLIRIAKLFEGKNLSVRNYLFLRLPFSIYFGWITIATIANVTTMLVSWGWEGFGLSQATWTVIVLILGAVIGLWTLFTIRDAAYGLVVLWGYIGIIVKHQTESGWDGQFPNVLWTLYIACAIVFLACAWIATRQVKQKLDY